MNTLEKIDTRLAQLKSRRVQVKARQEKAMKEQRRKADTTAKILCGAIVIKYFPQLAIRAAERMSERDKMRYVDALVLLETIDEKARSELLAQQSKC